MNHSLLSIKFTKFSKFRHDYSVMEYGDNYWFLWIHIHIKRFLIWDIRLSKFWLWRKIRELQGETYI